MQYAGVSALRPEGVGRSAAFFPMTEDGPPKELLDVLNYDLIRAVDDQVVQCAKQTGYRFLKV